ncbi:MAG: aldehyde ferredoxin oxidoreductase family protein [Rhodospirillales bacterium]
MGWHGRILRVDLTRGEHKEEPLNMEWAQMYMGQRGLATKYLFEEMDPKTDPLSPENKLIIATGPLTGTMAATGGRWSAVTKGALTGAIACSNSGGQFGGELKMAGWDFIILEGKSSKPVYLYIENLNVQILDAEGFIWGGGLWDAEDKIRARHQDPQIKIAGVGVAGERMNRYACIVNDRDRAAGRSGVGAVMGSKNLKCIAVRGSGGVSVRDPKLFMQRVRDARARIDPTGLARDGTLPMMDITNAHGSLPTRNCRQVQFEGKEGLDAAAMRRPRLSDGQAPLKRNKACFACTIGCGRLQNISASHFSVAGGPQKYKAVSGGLEYETAFALGPMVGVDDIDAAQFANMLCNEHSMDPISLGGTISAAMELFEEGVMTLEDTGGVDLRFGDAKALTAAAQAAAMYEGRLGELLGMGSKRLCDHFGRPEFSMTVKGQEFAAYDPRAMQGMGLSYATSSRGACHLRADAYEDDFNYVRPQGKAKIVKETQDFISAMDSTGLCAFTAGAFRAEEYAGQVDGACEGDWTVEKFIVTGERIWNLEREFNNRAGFTAKDDTLPVRVLTEPAESGAGKGCTTQLDEMLPEYYTLRGWTPDGQLGDELKNRLPL